MFGELRVVPLAELRARRRAEPRPDGEQLIDGLSRRLALAELTVGGRGVDGSPEIAGDLDLEGRVVELQRLVELLVIPQLLGLVEQYLDRVGSGGRCGGRLARPDEQPDRQGRREDPLGHEHSSVKTESAGAPRTG